MKYNSQGSKSICIVLQAAKQELEHSSNYVERIIALNKAANMLKMLTDYEDLGEEIDHHLSISGNVSYRKISAYADRIKTLIAEQIQNVESPLYRRELLTNH